MVDNEKVVGFYYWCHEEDTSVLLSIQIQKQFQSKGYGSLLLRHWENEAVKHCCSKLGLAVHTINKAYDWYLKRGFKYLDEDGPNCHMMIKEINKSNK